MSTAAGYLLNVAPNRRDDLLSSIQFADMAAEAVPDFSHSRNTLLICFLSFEDKMITHLARGTKGKRAATGLTRLNFKDVLRLPEFIPYDMIANAVEPRLRTLVKDRLTIGGALPPATFEAITSALRELSATAREVLDRYVGDRSAVVSRMLGDVRRALAYQKDTVGVALALAGIERDELAAWQPATSHPTSFLDGLPQVVLREDAMVVSDMMKMPGFDFVSGTPYSAARFVSDRVRLTVTLANHLPLEEQFGADLIYYNETYASFVMVQYKAMEAAPGQRPTFRFPNRQLTEEIARMDEVNSLLRSSAGNVALSGYRLLENPFFLKLCPRVVLDPDNVGLLPGMYIPLDCWKLIELDESLVGARGGRMVSYENLDRYLENTTFISLVANGWIGTNINQAEVLAELVRHVLQSGRSLTLAVKSSIE